MNLEHFSWRKGRGSSSGSWRTADARRRGALVEAAAPTPASTPGPTGPTMSRMATTKDLLDQALELPRTDRASLARDLIASLDDPHDAPAEVQAAWLAEVRMRMREIADGSAELVDWETVRTEALARIRRS